MEIAPGTFPAIDLDAVQQLTRRQRKETTLFHHLMGHFQAEAPETIALIGRLMAAQPVDFEALHHQVHTLKGMAAVLGAKLLWDETDRAVRRVSEHEMPEPDLAERLCSLFEDYQAQIEACLQEIRLGRPE